MPEAIRVSIPYTYECAVRRPRKQKYVTERFGAFADLEIPVLSDEEAPVAVVREASEGWEGRDDKGPVRTRWYDEGFWEPLRGWQGGVTVDMLGEASRANPLIGSGWQGDLAISFAKDGRYEGSPDGFDNQPGTNTQDSVLSALLAEAQSLVVVDGLVWRQVPEPVLKLEQHFSFGTDTVRVMADSAPEEPRTDIDRGYQTFYFRADRMRDAELFADVLCKVFSPRNGEWYAKTKIEVLLPEVLSWKDEANDLSVAAGFIMRSFKEFENAPSERILDWVRLRDALKTHSEHLDEESSEAVMEALEDFMDHHEGRRDYVMNLFHAVCRRYEIAHGRFEAAPEPTSFPSP